MKKHRLTISGILLLLLVLFSIGGAGRARAAPAAYQGSGEATAVVTSSALNVRSGPGVNYGIVAYAQQGQQLLLLGRNSASSWVKVRLGNGREGWVNAAYVRAGIAIGSLPVLDGSPGGATAVVTSSSLNVRSGPGVGYAIVGYAQQGQQLTLLGRNSASSWVKVRLGNGREGWVNAAYVRASVAIGSLPVLDGGSVGATAIVATGALNVRGGPGVGYGVVTVAQRGTQLVLLGRNNAASWAMVRTPGGVEGWVNASLIQASVAIGSLPVVGAPGGNWTAVVNTGALNVRYGPGPGYSVAAVLQQGAQVTLIGRNSAASWVCIQLANGQQGWVNASYLQMGVAVGSLPIVW